MCWSFSSPLVYTTMRKLRPLCSGVSQHHIQYPLDADYTHKSGPPPSVTTQRGVPDWVGLSYCRDVDGRDLLLLHLVPVCLLEEPVLSHGLHTLQPLGLLRVEQLCVGVVCVRCVCRAANFRQHSRKWEIQERLRLI